MVRPTSWRSRTRPSAATSSSRDIELDYFKPITNRYNLVVDKGVLTANGHVEYGLGDEDGVADAGHDRRHPRGLRAHGSDGRRGERAAREGRGRRQAGEQCPDLVVRISELRLTRSTVGFVNKATTPPYRVFLTDTDGTVDEPQQSGSGGHGGRQAQGRVHGVRHRHRRGDLQIRKVRSRASTSGCESKRSTSRE